MQTAVFVNGQVICGQTHAHAASCLTDEAKDNVIVGLYDEIKKKFVHDTGFFYMKEILLVRHADAENDKLTSKGLAQIHKSLSSFNPLYRANLELISSPNERCEHTAWAIGTHLTISGKVNDEISEPATEENVVAVMDSLPDYSLLVVSDDFICCAIETITRSRLLYVPNLCVMRLMPNKSEEIAFIGQG